MFFYLPLYALYYLLNTTHYHHRFCAGCAILILLPTCPYELCAAGRCRFFVARCCLLFSFIVQHTCHLPACHHLPTCLLPVPLHLPVFCLRCPLPAYAHLPIPFACPFTPTLCLPDLFPTTTIPTNSGVVPVPATTTATIHLFFLHTHLPLFFYLPVPQIEFPSLLLIPRFLPILFYLPTVYTTPLPRSCLPFLQGRVDRVGGTVVGGGPFCGCTLRFFGLLWFTAWRAPRTPAACISSHIVDA